MQQLNDTEHYELINYKTQEEITAHVINEYKKIKTRITTSKLNKDDKQQLIKYTRPYASSTHFPKIYFNPKTHKPNIPLRPITSGISYHNNPRIDTATTKTAQETIRSTTCSNTSTTNIRPFLLDNATIIHNKRRRPHGLYTNQNTETPTSISRSSIH